MTSRSADWLTVAIPYETLETVLYRANDLIPDLWAFLWLTPESEQATLVINSARPACHQVSNNAGAIPDRHFCHDSASLRPPRDRSNGGSHLRIIIPGEEH